MPKGSNINYLEWQALVILYRKRERKSSPGHYVGLDSTITRLIRHHPPLAEWVGKSSGNQVHITDAGVSLYESGA